MVMEKFGNIIMKRKASLPSNGLKVCYHRNSHLNNYCTRNGRNGRNRSTFKIGKGKEEDENESELVIFYRMPIFTSPPVLRPLCHSIFGQNKETQY